MNQATFDFIHRHADEDVHRLALQVSRDADIDIPFALDQISGRQTARHKLPSWAAVDDIIYPPHLNMEQCSSETTARYKQQLVRRLMSGIDQPTMADLTGGFGVDCSFLAPVFSKVTYVERDERLCTIAEHNFHQLHLNQIQVRNDDSIAFLDEMPPVDFIFMDPARRDVAGRRVFFLSDCQPDVLAIERQLLSKCRMLLLKLSPMLDWHEAVRSLNTAFLSDSQSTNHRVEEVHIVSVGNECRELLLVVSAHSKAPLSIHCVNDDEVFSYEASTVQTDSVTVVHDVPEVEMYLFEPNASIMKAGSFGPLTAHYPIEALADNTRLFVAREPLPEFPGRQFRIESVTTLNRRDLRRTLDGIDQANITVRNFPMTVVELRRRLHLRDGGDTYIFAATVSPDRHLLFVCRK